MGTLEIVLLAAGAVIFIASFCIPVKQEKLKEETKELTEQEIKKLVSDELENVRGRLSEISEEEMQQQIEKTERSMERISNEKIMAVNEYSDTVLEEIHKNHEEVVFLYDMLKNKQESLSESYGKTDKNLQELLQQIKDSEITVKENLDAISKRQNELESREKVMEGRQWEADFYTAPRQTKSALETLRERAANRKAAEAVAEAAAEDAVLTEAGTQEAEAKTPSFKPFVPEKVEVVPKKKSTRKTTKKQETEEKEEEAQEKMPAKKPAAKRTAKTSSVGEKKEKTAAPGAFAAENADVMLMLSGSMEHRAANSNERILELHKAGKSNMAIARELGLGIGEVKLVIDLYEGMR